MKVQTNVKAGVVNDTLTFTGSVVAKDLTGTGKITSTFNVEHTLEIK